MDSPLAIEATNIFIKNVESCFDDEAVELVRRGLIRLHFQGLSMQLREMNQSRLTLILILRLLFLHQVCVKQEE